MYPESYIFKEPLSPHAAALIEGVNINLENITKPSIDKLIIEGAGGVMVPLSKKYFMIGLILQLDFPVIIVTSSALGTINHTLLTIEALRSRGAKIAGVIMNGETNKSNKLAIEEYGRVKILFEFAPLSIVSTYELEKRKVNDELVNLFKEGL